MTRDSSSNSRTGMTSGAVALRLSAHPLGRFPDQQARLYLAGAGAIWIGIACGVWVRWSPTLVMGAVALAVATRKWTTVLIVGLAAVGVVGGLLLAARDQRIRQVALPAGEMTLLVEALADGGGSPGEGWVRARVVAVDDEGTYRSWNGPAGWLRGAVSHWKRSSRWWVETVMEPIDDTGDRVVPGRYTGWGGEVAGARSAGVARGWLGKRVFGTRNLIIDRLRPDKDRGRALLGGFLLGDTSYLEEVDTERMRRAGLSHFVAVSGSNVALFLSALFLLAGPLGWSSRRRAVLGLGGLGFFVLLIGPDPSVVRAATMAGLVLVARPFGLRPDIWRVIAIGVGLLLLASPELAFSLGFQLSVAATAGVVIGAGWFEALKPKWVGTALGASCGAQLAVAPILLLAVGSIPLWSPVANVMAAPLVVAATGLGGAGALVGVDLVVAPGAAAAGAVLAIAEVAAELPQVDWRAFLLLTLIASATRWRRMRPAAVLALAITVGVLTVSFAPHTFAVSSLRPAFVVLDVGQGDALLLLGKAGETVMVDGGSSGLRVRDGLSRFGIRAIDLLVVSHAHHDHYGGLSEVVGALPVGALWYAPSPGQGDEFRDFVAAAVAKTEVLTPGTGLYHVGSISLEVLGPVRRYASLNDQSLVVLATVGSTRILLSGDIERIAQSELEPPEVAVLKVPHQGAATSDPEWLIATGASIAVVSVGPNRYGHPSPGLLAELQGAGMEVRRTDLEGDVVIRLRP